MNTDPMKAPMTADPTPIIPEQAAAMPPEAPTSRAIPRSEMRCPTAGCHHPMSMHEALEGPCHHGEASGARCQCPAFGGGTFVPKSHGAAEAPRTLPVRPLQSTSQPVRGPSPVTADIEDEAAARVAARLEAQRQQDADDAAREGQLEAPTGAEPVQLGPAATSMPRATRTHRHRFPLRRGHLVEIELPEDLNVKEVERMHTWMLNLIVPGE